MMGNKFSDLHNIVVIGTGNVGKALLKQLAGLVRCPARPGHLALAVVAIANENGIAFSEYGFTSRQMEGIVLDDRIERLKGFSQFQGCGIVSQVRRRIGTDSLTFVDVTAADLTDLHLEALRRGHAVVTANKKPVTASMDVWRELMSYGPRRYRFECTCGAALPVIRILQDCIATGDRILGISAMVSGSLGQILSYEDESYHFGRRVSLACEAGYTEPDPRDDLSGKDVARKAVILARLAGATVELSDIKPESLFPPEWADCGVDEFMERLLDSDDNVVPGEFMTELRCRMVEAIAPYRYLVTLDCERNHWLEVGLKQAIGSQAPFADLHGPRNLFVIRTERNDTHPIVIGGAGAGPVVTAGGVLADILEIVH
jgi:homoserine dehydrogenase